MDDAAIFREPVIDVVIEDAERIRAALAGVNPDRCCLCNRTCFNSKNTEYDLEGVYYRDDCPRCGRSGLSVLQVRGVITNGPNTARIRTIYDHDCSRPDCRGPLVPPPPRTVGDNRASVTVPEPQLLNLRAEEHHVSYEPERTITVCRVCHGKIHASEDGLEPLQPDQSRAEGLEHDG
jgi:hypothetical protein